MIEPFRINPNLPAAAYQTYSIRQPADTTVVAACEQVGCAAWARGWESAVDESTELGRQQAAYIRQRSGRTFREQRTAAALTVFRFDSGQRCFAEHRTRPQLFAVRDGDWRGNPTGRNRKFDRADQWVYDFSEHQDKIETQRERG